MRTTWISLFCRNSTKLARRKHRRSHLPDLSASEDSLDKYTYKISNNEDSNLPAGYRSKSSSMAPGSHDHGLLLFDIYRLIKRIKTYWPWFLLFLVSGFSRSSANQLYISSFHTTPERRRFSKPDWEKFTRDSTERALEELVSSPGFGKWLSKNADRISVTPPSSSRAEHGRKWFQWF